jgi:hypothetical protein
MLTNYQGPRGRMSPHSNLYIRFLFAYTSIRLGPTFVKSGRRERDGVQ